MTIENCAADECGATCGDQPIIFCRPTPGFDWSELKLEPGRMFPVEDPTACAIVRNSIPLWSEPV